MLWTLALTSWTASAAAPAVTLHVGIPHAAGDLDDVRVDGHGPCRRADSRIHCPGVPDGPVTFTWTGDPAFVLHPLAPDPNGVRRALVLSAPGSHPRATAWLQALRTDPSVEREDLLRLRQLTVFTSDWTPPWPSPALLDAHLDLLDHPDRRVRREAVEGLHPWLAGTSFDPLPRTAPVPVDADALRALANDPDPGVRRRLARILRDARPAIPPSLVESLMRRLLRDRHPGVRRATLVALPDAVDHGVFMAEEAWELLLQAVPRPRPAGRAACNQLARMKPRLERAEREVDPVFALEMVLRYHPERAWRVWSAWREQLPVKQAWVSRLLQDTVGVDRALILHWQREAPDILQAAVDAWQPTRHPERAELVERLRREPAMDDDSLSGASGGSEAP